MNLLYIVWWEGATHSDLLRTQVFDLLLAMRRELPPEARVVVWNGAPFFKTRLRAWLQDRPGIGRYVPNAHVRNRVDLEARHAVLAAAGITYIPRETLVAPRTVYLRPPLLPLFPLGHLRAFRRVCRKQGITVVHARSYNAAFVALVARAWWRLPVKVLLDLRGPIPEEGVMAGVLRDGGIAYRLWKRVERWMLARVDGVASLSEPFSRAVRAISAHPKVYPVLPCVDTDPFLRPGAVPESVRLGLRAGPTTRVLVYLGTIRPRAWISAEGLADLYAVFRRAFPDARLLVITRADPAVIGATLAANGVPAAECVFFEADDARSVAAAMRAGHYAAVPFMRAPRPVEAYLGATIVAVKTPEYLAAGLPVFCDEGIGGAADLVRHNAVGCLFGAREPDPVAALRAVEADYAATRARCLALAAECNAPALARRYRAIYADLLAPPSREAVP